MSGDTMTWGDIRQVTRDIMVYVSTSSDTQNSTDIRDQYEYQKTIQFQEK